MSIAFIGAATGTTSASLAAISWIPGDIALVFAFRDGSTTNPTRPTGWTAIGPDAGVDGTTCSERCAYRILQSGDTGSGTWTNATSVVMVVYRGQNVATPIGDTNTSAGTSNTVTFNSLTMTQGNGSSMVVGFIGHRSSDTTIETAPTGMFNRANVQDATDEASAHDTRGGVASWSSTNLGITGTASGWITRTIEILAEPPVAGSGQFVELASGNGASGTSFNTASVSPPANRLILLGVHWRRAPVNNDPTVTGNGLTWTKIASQQVGTDTGHRIALYKAYGAAPTGGVVNVDFGESIERASYEIVYCAASTSSVVEQFATAGANAVSELVVPFTAAFQAAQNLPYAFFGPSWVASTGDMAPAVGWTQITEIVNGATTHISVYAGAANLGPGAVRATATDNFAGIAIEVQMVAPRIASRMALLGVGV